MGSSGGVRGHPRTTWWGGLADCAPRSRQLTADPNILDRDGFGPLMCVALGPALRHLPPDPVEIEKIVRELAGRKARIDLRSVPSGETPWMAFVTQKWADWEEFEPLWRFV